jgi:hypothetical protein
MKNLKTFDAFLNESNKDSYKNLRKFLETTLTDEKKGYYWIFTNSTLKGDKLSGNINDNGGLGKYSRTEVEDDLKNDKKEVDKKIKLLEQAIKEFNKENNVNLIFTYKLNNPKITTNTWQGSVVYDSENLVASVIITQN